jgi:hypothetical protein
MNPTQFVGLLCEDVRQEVGSKFTLVGVYAGEIVNIPATAPPSVNFVFSFVFIFRDGEGSFTPMFRLSGPQGPIGAPLASPTITKNPGDPMICAFQYKPTPPLSRGTYKAQVEFSGRAYDFSFTIRDAPIKH